MKSWAVLILGTELQANWQPLSPGAPHPTSCRERVTSSEEEDSVLKAALLHFILHQGVSQRSLQLVSKCGFSCAFICFSL